MRRSKGMVTSTPAVYGAPVTQWEASKGQGANGIFEGFLAYKSYSADELRDVLRTALVVFDTNVLLDLYRYNTDSRTSIVAVMSAIGDRLWLPHQVMEEFWRNRERALADPLREVGGSLAKLNNLQNSTIEELRIWVNRASLNVDVEAPIEENLNSAFEAARAMLAELVDETEIRRARSTYEDPVLKMLETALASHVGFPMSAHNYETAVKEGQRRAAAGEPPGYADAKKADRNVEGAAGDFLVWEQILTEAEQRKPQAVLFVTGDVKRDWWRFEGTNPRGPRIELSREMANRCGAELFMIEPRRLLELADAVSVSVLPESVEDVSRTSRFETEITDDARSTGWTRAALDWLMRRLAHQAPVQEATIRFAARNGGFVSRDEVYELGEYDPSRQLKGFTRPVNRFVQVLKDSEQLPEEATDVLVPVYDEGTYGLGWADGFRVPDEIVNLLAS